MPGRRMYDLMYRVFAPWSHVDRPEIRRLVNEGPCDPAALSPPDGGPARAIDLGCGEGGVAIWLAQAGFHTTGVDFSPVALRKARDAASKAGLGEDRITFVEADLTADAIPEAVGPYDLLVDYSTLDDLPARSRARMARLIGGLARPGSCFFLEAWVGASEDLPRISLIGPSRITEHLEPGEVERLFDDGWRIEQLPRPDDRFIADFLLTRT